VVKCGRKSFDKITTYLFEDWGEFTAKTYVRKASVFIDILRKFPEIGTLENSKKNIRGFVLSKEYNCILQTERRSNSNFEFLL
jgi:plasmid stabilization system protein ParE